MYKEHTEKLTQAKKQLCAQDNVDQQIPVR